MTSDHDIESYREPWAAVSHPQSTGNMWLRAFEAAQRGAGRHKLVREYGITADQANHLIKRARDRT